jgi:hypothetical protein
VELFSLEIRWYGGTFPSKKLDSKGGDGTPLLCMLNLRSTGKLLGAGSLALTLGKEATKETLLVLGLGTSLAVGRGITTDGGRGRGLKADGHARVQ